MRSASTTNCLACKRPQGGASGFQDAARRWLPRRLIMPLLLRFWNRKAAATPHRQRLSASL